MHLTTIDEVKNYSNVFAPSSDDYSILSDTGNQEIIRILDEKLTDEYRTIYLRLKNGSKINKADQIKLYNKIKEILGDVSNG